MKYVIEIPSKADFVTAYYMEDGLPVMYKSDKIDDLEPYTEPDRKAIEDEVWEFARGLLNYTDDDWEVITNMLLLDIPYQEAKTKFEAWLKQKDEIRVGDEVYPVNPKAPRVVTKIENRVAYQMGYDGNMWADDISDLHKTGRHFDEVAELLRKMRGEEE